MIGRSKGGDGTRNGIAKTIRDNSQGITKPAIRRLACRGDVKRISRRIYELVFVSKKRTKFCSFEIECIWFIQN